MKVNTSNSLDLIEVLDLLISDLFLNSSETSLMSINSNSLKDSLFYVSRAKPSISFKDYMRRFQRFTKCSNEIFLIGFIYFDRIIQKNNLIHNRINVHKYFHLLKLNFFIFFLFLKKTDDCFIDNCFKISGGYCE